MDNALAIALTGGVVTVITLIVGYATKRSEAKDRARERADDWARQDVVANRLEAVASAAKQQVTKTAILLAHNQETTAAARDEVRDRLAEATKVTNDKLDVIHTLVNSNMTAAMQAEYDATTRELAMMREVVGLKQAAGHAPSADALAAIEATGVKLGELRATIEDRLKRDRVSP